MCLQKIKVLDKGGYRSPRYSNYNCGHCAACRQQNANSKVQKIASHNIKGMLRYFVTLTYDNDNVPVISKSEFERLGLESYINLKNNGFSSFDLPVYRGINKKQVLTPITFKDFTDYRSVHTLRGVVTKYNKDNPDESEFHEDLVSISYSKDIVRFFKRLRKHLFYHYKKNIPVDYFYAPEYGPTTFRFHAHFIMWFPEWMSEFEVRHFIAKSWKFCDRDRLFEGIELARSADHYVASYVNCDASIPQFLLENFPLRQTHSLGFGFHDGAFTLKEVLKQFENDDYGFNVSTVNKDGNVEVRHFLYSKSLIHRYFPYIKGFSRLSKNTILSILYDPEKNLGFVHPMTNLDSFVESHTTDKGTTFYKTFVHKVDGIPLAFTPDELKYTINRINRCYLRFQDLGYTREQFAETVYKYYVGRFSYIYKILVTDENLVGFSQLYAFDNIQDLPIESLPTFEEYVSQASFDDLDPSLNPYNKSQHQKYYDQYLANIKQRKLNSL